MTSSSVTSGCPPPPVAPAGTATLNMVPKHTRFIVLILRRASPVMAEGALVLEGGRGPVLRGGRATGLSAWAQTQNM